MTLQHTTQQFTPIILGFSLATIDQQVVVEQYLEQSTLSSHPRLNNRHSGLDPESSNLGKTTASIADIIWLNQLDKPLGIEQWRDLLPQIQSTIDNRTLVVAILHADTLSLATQNAMLKSLEEPPSHVQFLLATTRPTALLPTIQSRCHLLRFQQEKQSTSQIETITLLNSVIDGSMSDALIASDQFKDRDQAKAWIIQVLDWSQKQLNHTDRQALNFSQKPNDLEATIDLDYPTWITALLTAHQQLEQNLHVKLVMDQLFLTLINEQR